MLQIEQLINSETMAEISHDQPGAPGVTERRAHPRSTVLKSAKLVLTDTNTVYDCLVLDESCGGAQVDFSAMIKVPENVVIRFSNGAAFPAQRRWTAGTKAGLQYTGEQIVGKETAARMKAISEIIELQGLPAAVSTLRTARFFDNAELRRAAEEAEAAMFRLQVALKHD